MNDFPVVWVACGTVLVLIAMLLGNVCRRIHFPYTIALVLVGMLLNDIGEHVPRLAVLDTLHLTPNFTLYVLLPTLVFDAALHLDVRGILRNALPILLLAVPGVMVVTALAGLGVARWTPLGLNAAMLFGALISTTDPVACIALFNEIGAPPRLTLLVDAESLMNDATAIVMFDLVSAIVASSLLLPDPAAAWNLHTLVHIPLDFLWIFCGSAVVGAAVGLAVMLIIRWTRNDALTEIALTTVVAYAAFTLANRYLGLSGVMAACGAGLAVKATREWLSPETRNYLHDFWGFASFMANSVIFLMLGLTESYLIRDMGRLSAVAAPLAVAIVLVLATRALIVGGTGAFCNLVARARKRPGDRIPLPMQAVMTWSGLRGALPVALAVSVPTTLVSPEERKLLVQLTVGTVLFTLLVQGTTIKPMLRALGLSGAEGAKGVEGEKN
jgi:CPA1 family monovalent cation:H+ antiporter